MHHVNATFTNSGPFPPSAQDQVQDALDCANKEVRDALERASREAHKAATLRELADLLDQYPEVGRILDLMKEVANF